MLVVVDYKMGNLGSIVNMFSRIGVEATRTSDPGVVAHATKLVLPGVGAFDNGMAHLRALGLEPILNMLVMERKIPILGLCLGMQLFGTRSEEGSARGLGWVDAESVKFAFAGAGMAGLRIPHMGWNTAQQCQPHWLFDERGQETRYYFVHSYHVCCHDERDVLAKTQYGIDFVSALGRDNIIGVQFHPEKSLRWGMEIFKRFAAHG